MRVLLVEDHEEIWDFLSRRLKRRGYDVTVATDGQAGVDRARADLPQIVLLDMNLPILDGWSAARQHTISLLCDDLEATVAELRGRGAVIEGEPADRPFGLCVMVQVPGADPIMLYQPKHRLAYGL